MEKLEAQFSDRYLNSGTTKGQVTQYLRPYVNLVTSVETAITDFIPAGDKAYLAGFSNTNLGKNRYGATTIIKENGEWKWYGNQRDVAR